MLQIRRILIPTDFSACAEGAFTHAAYLAQRTGAELHVLHVVVGKAEPPSNWIENFRTTFKDIGADLDLSGSRLPDTLPDVDRETGNPTPVIEVEEKAQKAGPAIIRYAEANDVDLVVMGTHGRRGLQRLLMGSVAEEVVRHAPCPVFTVGTRDTCEESWSIRRIVAPVDFSSQSRLAARHAAALAEFYDAELNLLHVIDEDEFLAGAVPNRGSFRKWTEEALLESKEVLERQAAMLKEEFPGVGGVGTFVRVGHPAPDIVSFAESSDVDLLVLGTQGRTGLERLRMGSVAEEAVRLAPCPVFTVKNLEQRPSTPAPEHEQSQPEQTSPA